MFNWFQNLKIKNKILLGNSVGIFLLAGFAFSVYLDFNKLQESSRWVTHTEKVIATGHELM
jgi:CHASE3 domain sensor protein